MERLKGKRALITGGTSGIGLETARQFLQEGARVLVTGMQDETLAAARSALGGEALLVKLDAGDIAAQAQLADLAAEHFGQLDVAVLNAGIGVFRPLAQWDEAAFDRSFGDRLPGFRRIGLHARERTRGGRRLHDDLSAAGSQGAELEAFPWPAGEGRKPRHSSATPRAHAARWRSAPASPCV